LGREHNVIFNLVQEFATLGAPIHFKNLEVGDLSDADSWFMFYIRAGLVEWERRKVVQRMTRGAKEARSQGVLFSGIPNHFKEVSGGLIEPDDVALDMFEGRMSRLESIPEIAERHRTYIRDVQRTIDRVRRWKERTEDWKRGRKGRLSTTTLPKSVLRA
jgi:DNA invertase Pin-like site-specific DNA recombinase